ncbi:uncharacterized protein BX663DRAFT_504811 [Cokeromyces recurvatus]|uniref:uncharacterized protein n=1 Tax=Cokeromyces recurvatus TaxID=90255 RepID=UPI00221E7762|nr:uncharacterized protein BX663DRAFT_504811 [Cokeromyces recurvatus]KAI7904362.1 hypothetical protein BX663DRAFT_504811 [Cokeromyces recurvatus]
MNLEDYRFTYNGDDVYMQFFKEKSLKDWNYKTFKSHFSTLRNPPTKKTLVIAYKHCLKVIKNNPATPKCIKPLIEKLLKDLNDSSSVSPTNVYNINQGPSSIVNYGNNNNISTVGQKRVFDNIEQEQTKKDTPSSASNVQKSHQLRDKIDDLFNPLPDSSLSPAQFRNNIYACGIKIVRFSSEGRICNIPIELFIVI